MWMGGVAGRPLDANPRMFAPAGAMRMNLPDWSRFCIEHLKGGHGRGQLVKGGACRFRTPGRAAPGSRWAGGRPSAGAARGRC